MQFIELPKKILEPHPKDTIVAFLRVNLKSVSLLLGPEIAGVRPVSVPFIFPPGVSKLNKPDFLIASDNFVKIKDTVSMTHNESIRLLEFRDSRMRFSSACHQVGSFKSFFYFVEDFVCFFDVALGLLKFVESWRSSCEVSKCFAQNPRVNFVVSAISLGICLLDKHRSYFVLSLVRNCKDVSTLSVHRKVVINHILNPLAVNVEPDRIHAILVDFFVVK